MQTTLSERGIVSSRVALLLRSAEIKPLFHGFVIMGKYPSSIFGGRRGGQVLEGRRWMWWGIGGVEGYSKVEAGRGRWNEGKGG